MDYNNSTFLNNIEKLMWHSLLQFIFQNIIYYFPKKYIILFVV